MYLKDVLASVGVPLSTPTISAPLTSTPSPSPPPSPRSTKPCAKPPAPEDRPVRLIGSSLGAYVAAVYASRCPENADVIDRIMLLAPTFKPAECLEGVEREMGMGVFGDAFRERTWRTHPDFPFAPCRPTSSTATTTRRARWQTR